MLFFSFSFLLFVSFFLFPVSLLIHYCVVAPSPPSSPCHNSTMQPGGCAGTEPVATPPQSNQIHRNTFRRPEPIVRFRLLHLFIPPRRAEVA
ncbi:hypothetical protein BX600DRAFT_451256 [Xylariales sp. PMI_506]|nr:hypothetical protein BX600DRAFT_451256 [Xylariales sp. PMI_506]